MPDLSGKVSPLFPFLAVQLLAGEKGLSRKASLYRREFIRLVDKAAREYREAREVLLDEVAVQGRNLRFYVFTDHMETCINAVSRLSKLLKRIKSEKEAPDFPRELRRLVEKHSEFVTDVRDTVEHMDERIQKGAIAPGKPIMLTCSQEGDKILVSNSEMKFTDLAMLLEKMHEIALYILAIRQ
jgi:hypothetical protein